MRRDKAEVWVILNSVRVERVQDITEEDAIKEGSQTPCDQLPRSCQQAAFSERQQFARIWDSINASRKDKEGQVLPYSWEDNPFAWVLEYRLFFQGRG
jgi:hypothetical protein